MPFFSVISCLYNVSAFFQTGLNCLLQQSFQDYEIILIDDGSTDSTSVLADDALCLSEKIKVIHQKNSGLGAARNTGIKAAEGKYLCFYDMDDKVGKDWLEIIYNNLVGPLPQIMIYGYREINEKYGTCVEFTFPDMKISSNTDIGNVFPVLLSGFRFNNGFVWNKVYNKDFILKHDIYFPDLRIQQDEVFNHKAYVHAESLIMISDILYDYYIYESCNNRSRFIPDRLECFITVRNSFLSLMDYWNSENRDVLNYIHSRFLSNSLFNRNPNLNFKLHKKEILGIMRNPEIMNSIKFLKANNYREFSMWMNMYLKHIRRQSWRGIFLTDRLRSTIRALKNRLNFIRKLRRL